MNDEKWMHAAIEQALLAERIDEVPIGAVIVRDGQVIAAAHNTRSVRDPVRFGRGETQP